MVKLNLLKKDWTGLRQISKIKMIVRGLTIFVLAGFLIQVFYVSGRLIFIKNKTEKTEAEIESLERQSVQEKESVQKYVWAKNILDSIEAERLKEYKYKDYLIEINSWLVNGTYLASVSFVETTDIVFVVHADGVDSYREFEAKTSELNLGESSLFASLKQESLARLEDGSYNIKMRVKIK